MRSPFAQTIKKTGQIGFLSENVYMKEFYKS